MPSYESLLFTGQFLDQLVNGNFTASEQRRLLRAIELIDANEQHPSLRIHQLRGEFEGIWSASASDVLRITFKRLDRGRKMLLGCSRHYQR